MKRFMAIIFCVILLTGINGCAREKNQIMPIASAVLTTVPKESIAPIESPVQTETIAPIKTPVTTEDTTLKTFTLEQVQQDFKKMQTAIEVVHPKFYTDKKELKKILNKQYKLLKDGMNEAEFYRVIAPVVAAIRCEHSKIIVSSNYQNYMNEKGLFLPVAIKIIDGRAYVYESFDPYALPPGAEVMSINGKKITDIIRTLMENIPADGTNETEKLWLINLAFQDLYYEFIETPDNFTIEYKNVTETKTVTIPAVDKAKLAKTLKSFIPFEERKVTLLDQEFNDGYAVLSVKSFYYDGVSQQKIFESFIDNFFIALAEKNISGLIIDMRDNWGGVPERAAYLFSYLEREAEPFLSEEYAGAFTLLKEPVTPAANVFTGKVYVLANGGSNSATGFICALLKYHRLATFIGEETGGGSICTAINQTVDLSNTGFAFLCATKTLGTAVEGEITGKGIMPDYTVIPSIQDLINNKDIAKEFAIDLINEAES